MTARATVPTRPVLRYHGGKWRLAPWLLSFFPPHRVYVEPFGGAASVLLRKQRSYAEVYNDLDGEVVNVFRVLRDPITAAALRERVRLTPFARAEYVAAQEPDDDPIEQARRTLVKSWLGFGSGAVFEASAGLRVSMTGRRHTPAEWARFPEVLPQFTDRLTGVLIEHRPASEVMARHDAAGALLFLDPPYVRSERGERHRYRHEMSDADHASLAQQARALTGMVVLCGYDSALYRGLYEGWAMHTRETIDAVSLPRTEVVWLNPACSAALAQSRQQLQLLPSTPVPPPGR